MNLQAQRIISLGNEKIYLSNSALPPVHTWNVQRHCNAEWELHYIAKGSCRVDLDQGHYHLTAGQALLIQPGIYHGAEADDGDFSRLTICFQLSAGFIRQQLAEKLRQVPVFSPNKSIRDTGEKILFELEEGRAFADSYLSALISCLMVELLRFFQVDGQQKENNLPSPETQLTQTIDTYFEQHLSDSAGETELAKKLHISRRQLIRVLKKHYAMTFREKLIQARMDRAAFLLRTTSLSVNQIGAEVGYDSESAFFKVFRKNHNLTPGQYREQHK